MRRPIVAMFAGAAALGIACASFSADEGASPATAPDASTDAVSSTDGAPPDAAPPTLDGGAPSALCSDPAAHDFCEDFDERALSADGWVDGDKSAPDAGVAQLDMAQSKSPPSSLLVGLSTVGFKTQRSFFLAQNLPKPSSKKTVLAFDLFVAALDGDDGGAQSDSLVVGLSDGAYGNQIRVANTGGQLRIGVEETILSPKGYFDPTYTFGGAHFAVNAWHHFELVTNRQTNLLVLTVDGIGSTPAAGTKYHVPPGASAPLGLSLGAQTDSAGETIRLYFDNVTVDIDR